MNGVRSPSPLPSRENQFDNPRGKSSSRQEGSDNEEGRTAPTGETKSVDGPTLSTRGWKKRRLPYIALSYVTRTGPNLTKTFLIWLCFQHSYTFLIGLRILYYGLTGCNLIWIFEFLIGILFGLGLNPFVIVPRLWWAYKPDNSWINVGRRIYFAKRPPERYKICNIIFFTSPAPPLNFMKNRRFLQVVYTSQDDRIKVYFWSHTDWIRWQWFFR